MYELVIWFTECPYFNFVASVCSIGSAIAIINFLYFRKPKPVTPSKDATEIVDILIKMTEKHSDFWLPFGTDDLDKFPDLEGQK